VAELFRDYSGYSGNLGSLFSAILPPYAMAEQLFKLWMMNYELIAIYHHYKV